MLAFSRMFLLKKIRDKIQNFIFARQADILSAALVLSVSILTSRLLGLVRDRVLAHYFSGNEISLYFAAFRLPDTLFEILVFGTLSAAFIPTFVSYLAKGKDNEAWKITGIVLNFSFLAFLALAGVVYLFALPLSAFLTPGFSSSQVLLMAQLTRILLVTQGLFVLSFFLTDALKSYQRFLIPAIAPVFYNLGIIAGVIFLSPMLGIFAPVWGAVLGAFLHFAVQLPLAMRLGFRPVFSLDLANPGVRKILRLAAPRFLELLSLQVLKASDLFFASLISTASYGYLTFAQHLEMLPVSLFALSLAEASLPALSYKRGEKDFAQTFFAIFRQIIFLVLPVAAAFIVLRIPLVRLAFGAARFTWDSTVLTGLTLSVFALGVLGQALALFFARAFYSLHNTVTPVAVGIADAFLNVFLSAIFVLVFKLPVWGLAFSFAISTLLQALVLGLLLVKMKRLSLSAFLYPLFKVTAAAAASGLVMYVLLRLLDRSAYGLTAAFVLDTRYTINLLILTVLVGAAGALVYLFLCKLLRVKEISIFAQIWRRLPRLEQVVPPASLSEDEH